MSFCVLDDASANVPARSFVKRLRHAVLATTLMLGCATTTTTAPAPPPTPPPTLAGAWQSACFAVHNADDTDGSARIVHGFTDTLWSMDTALFSDAACVDATATLHVDGGYVLEGPSTSTNGAWDVRFEIRSRTITPHVEGFIAFLQAMSCGDDYGVDRATDAFEVSCAAFDWPAATTCGTELDVVRVDGTTLWRGLRPTNGDLCAATQRPTALGLPTTRM